MNEKSIPDETHDASKLIALLRGSMTRRQLAESLGVSTSTVERWESGKVECRQAYVPALRELYYGTTHEDGDDFRTIDLFAGIGGIPDCDVVLAGFPCQPFSLAGVAKKRSLGRATGFRDKTQGTLFFDVARIIAAKRPAAFLLENVKNLTSHDHGRTFQVILDTLRDELGYEVHWKVVDGQHFVPQHRERIYIVGFRGRTDFTWDDLKYPEHKPVLADILHRADGTEPYLPWDGDRFFDHEHGKVQDKYTLTPRLWQYLQDYKAKHEALGHGFGYGLVTPDMVSRTLSARYHKDGSEILVAQEGDRPRRLTPRECARLMGYPDDFRIPVSDTQAYRQFGNSVVVPAVAEIARIMRPHILGIMAEGEEPGLVSDSETADEAIQKARRLAVAGAGSD